MPGFALQYDQLRPLTHVRSAFQRAFSLISHLETYQQHILDVAPHCLLGWSAYPEYPLRSLEMPGAMILLDGVIYSPSIDALFSQAKRIDGEPDRCELMAAWLRKWLPGCDAECVIVYLERRAGGGGIIANDSLGRLPLYWATEGRRVLVSREIKMMTPFLQGIEGDRQGIAETLHFGFPLGPRTLLKGVSRLGPGTILTLSPGRPATQAAYHTWSFDTERIPAVPPTSSADDLADTFVEACARRTHAFPGRKAVLFLSGGLDSRAVAGGLTSSGCRFDTLTTTLGRDAGRDPECIYGAGVASHLRAPHQVLALREPLPTDHQWIIELRDGLNYAAMAVTRQLYAAVRAQWGDATVVFTGDGGDKVMPCLHPRRRVPTIRSLASMVSAGALVFDRGSACRIAGLSQAEFMRGIEETIEGYPEREIADRYVHFAVFERGFKWLFEGEERSRSMMWATTPFYGQDFVQQAMAVPPKWKISRRWYCAFLRALSPELVLIPDANTGHPPGTAMDSGREWLKRIVRQYAGVEVLVRRMRRHRHKAHSDEPARWLPGPLSQYDGSELLASTLRMEEVHTALDRTLDPVEHWQLATILWYLYRLDSTRWFGRLE